MASLLKTHHTSKWFPFREHQSAESEANMKTKTDESQRRRSPRNPITLSDSSSSISSLVEDAEVLVNAVEKRRPSGAFKKTKPLKEDAEALLAVFAQTRATIDRERSSCTALESDPAKKPQRDAMIKASLTACHTYRVSLIKPLSSILREAEYRNVDYTPYIQVASTVHARIEQGFKLLIETKTLNTTEAVGTDRSLTPIAESPQVKPQ